MIAIKKGNFEVQILKHSRNPVGLEAITFQWTYERMIHAEVLTHRWSRNYSSSRAIPYAKMTDWIAADPAQSQHIGSNRPGMQAGAEIDHPARFRGEVEDKFREMRAWCDMLVDTYDPHKEVINRYTEPWGWITGMATMGRAQFMNFISLRCSAYANPNIQRLAINCLRLYRDSAPRTLRAGQWHTPYFDDYVPEGNIGEPSIMEALIWSAARSAWISYNNPTKDATFEKARRRHDDCVTLKHVTPLEHQLRARSDRGKTGLVPGFDSYRMMIPGESATDVDIDAILERYGDRDYIVPARRMTPEEQAALDKQKALARRLARTPEIKIPKHEPAKGQGTLPLRGWDLCTSRPLTEEQRKRADELAKSEAEAKGKSNGSKKGKAK